MVKAAKTPSQPLRTTRVSVKPAAAAPVITTVLRAKRNAPAAKAGPKNKQSPARSKADEECKSKGEQRWERKRPAAQEKVPMIDLEGQDENEDATNTPKRQRTASSPARSRTPQQQTETPRKPPSPCTPAKTPRAARSPARSPAIQPEAKPSTPAKTPTPRAKRSLASSPAEQPADKKPITPAKSPRAARSPAKQAAAAAATAPEPCAPPPAEPFDYFKEVMSALHLSSFPDEAVGRDDEEREILDFCRERVERRQGGTMYVCGCPGTGKTLVLDLVRRKLDAHLAENGRVACIEAYVNAMHLNEPKAVYESLLNQMGAPPGPARDASSRLEAFVAPPKANKDLPMIVAVVDEVDALVTRDQEVLYRLFQVASLPRSRMILVGIANAIDLTERLLPRLLVRNLQPKLVTFRPYDKTAIIAIVRERLARVAQAAEASGAWRGPQPLPATLMFDAMALELCARRIAGQSGDARRALDVCWQAAQAAQERSRRPPPPPPSPSKKAQAPPPPPPPPSAVLAASFPWGAPGRVSVGDMQRTLGACIGSPHEETMRGLPSQHQLVLATAVVASRAGGVPPKQLTLQRLHTEYARALKKHHLQPLAFSEFVDLCEALGDHALLRVAAGKDPRARRVTVAVQEGDAVRALSSVAVVGAILAPPKPKE
eukprot:tig00021070_g17875.t1